MGGMTEKIKTAMGFRGLRPWKRHSLVLLVAGFVYIGIGCAYLISSASVERQSSMRLQLELLPLDGWGLIYIAVGLASIVSSRWPPASETWGYTLMTGLATFWAASYAGGILLGAPLENWSSVLIWALVAFLWWAISGLVNPESQVQKLVIITIDTNTEQVDAHEYDVSRERGVRPR